MTDSNTPTNVVGGEISKGLYEAISTQARLDELERLFNRTDGDRSARRYTSIVEQRVKVLKKKLAKKGNSK